MRSNWSIEFKDHCCWLLKALRKTKKLGFDGIKEPQCAFNLRTIYSNWKAIEIKPNWSIMFKDHSCWLLKALRRTKKLGFNGIKEIQCAFHLGTIYSNWNAIVRRNEVKLKHWLQRSLLLAFEGLKKNKEVGFWWN